MTKAERQPKDAPRDEAEERRPLVVHCGHCKHEWPIVWLPMEISRVGRIMQNGHCPNCASTLLRVGLRRAYEPFRDVQALLRARRESAHEELALLGLVDLGFGLVTRTESIREVEVSPDDERAVVIQLRDAAVVLRGREPADRDEFYVDLSARLESARRILADARKTEARTEGEAS